MLIQEDQVCINKLRNLKAIKLTHNNKTIVLINTYRILISFSKRLKYCLTQYNLSNDEVKSNSEYRVELLNKIKEYIKNNNTNNIIISGNYNQSIASKRLQSLIKILN